MVSFLALEIVCNIFALYSHMVACYLPDLNPLPGMERLPDPRILGRCSKSHDSFLFQALTNEWASVEFLDLRDCPDCTARSQDLRCSKEEQ